MQESQISLQDLENDSNSYDPTVTHDDFLDQMLSGLQAAVSWPDISSGNGTTPSSNKPWDVDHFDDQSTFLSSKLRQHQISPSSAVQSLLISRGLAGEPGFFQNDNNIDDSSFKSPIGDNNAIQNLFHGLTGSLTSNQGQQFRSVQAQMFGSPAGGGPSQPRQRVRARRGQATDPHSIAERLRRERIAERMKALQELVPNANKTDKASMLDEIIDYVKFLQLQVKVLSMSRLGGASAVAPLGTEGGGGAGRSSNGTTSSSTMTMTENQVVKLMEEDMGSAMQYLQGKGLCLMPISLATAISTPTNHRLLDAVAPSSPNMSALTMQSVNGVSVKDSP